MRIGDRVLTARELTSDHSTAAGRARRPSILGTVIAKPEGTRATYQVRHDDDGTAYYYGDELTLAPPGQLESIRSAIADELADVDGRLDEHQGELAELARRLDALEQAAPKTTGQPGGEAAEAARVWCDTLDAYRALHRAAKAWRDWRMLAPMGGSARQEKEAPIIDAVQMLDELDIDPGSEPPEPAATPSPDDTAPPPSDAAAEVLAARDELAAYQQRVMVALGYDGVDGPDPEQTLEDIATCAAPVRRLLEAYGTREIQRLAEGLRWWAADAPQHSVTRGGAEMLEQIAQLGNGDESP